MHLPCKQVKAGALPAVLHHFREVISRRVISKQQWPVIVGPIATFEKIALPPELITEND